MKWLGNFTKQETQDAYEQYQKLVKRDNMDMQTSIPVELVQGDIQNPKEWQLLKRTGSDDIYPHSKALFKNVHTGEVINGMWNEQDGSKLLGEIVQ